jgi:hypothetical protein
MGTSRATNAGGSLAVDAAGLVWSDNTGNLWTTSPASFGTPIQLITPPMIVPTNIRLDAANVYYKDKQSGIFYRSARNASGVTKLGSITAGHTSYQFAVDSASLYWTDYSANAVYSVPLDGSQVVTTVAQGQSGAFGIGVDPQAIYWTCNTTGSLVKLAK